MNGEKQENALLLHELFEEQARARLLRRSVPTLVARSDISSVQPRRASSCGAPAAVSARF